MATLDTSSLTSLINSFRQLQEKDSVTPESLGALLQRISDLLATVVTSDMQKQIVEWFDRWRGVSEVMFSLKQGNYDRNQILLRPGMVETVGCNPSEGPEIAIKEATTERAGAMKAQQVTDLNTLRNRYNDTVTPSLTALNAWHTAVKRMPNLFSSISQTLFPDDRVYLGYTKESPLGNSSEASNMGIEIAAASNSQAGVMTAEQCSFVNDARLMIKSVNIAKIDTLDTTDLRFGRLWQVRSTGGTDSWIMNITCSLYVTQVYFGHSRLDDDGQLDTSLGTHDELGFHIYKRIFSKSTMSWSKWTVIGGDAFATLESRVAKLESFFQLKPAEPGITPLSLDNNATDNQSQ